MYSELVAPRSESLFMNSPWTLFIGANDTRLARPFITKWFVQKYLLLSSCKTGCLTVLSTQSATPGEMGFSWSVAWNSCCTWSIGVVPLATWWCRTRESTYSVIIEEGGLLSNFWANSRWTCSMGVTPDDTGLWFCTRWSMYSPMVDEGGLVRTLASNSCCTCSMGVSSLTGVPLFCKRDSMCSVMSAGVGCWYNRSWNSCCTRVCWSMSV